MTMTLQASLESEITDICAASYADPLGWVRVAFPWGQPGPLLAHREPRVWQCEVLDWLGGEIQARGFDGLHAVDPIRFAISSGHGAGKGALCGMLTAFLMSTRRYAKGVVTANTSTQLQDKTWAAIQWWTSLCFTKHWFEVNTSIMYRIGERAAWKCSPQTCDPDNSEAFAGQHNLSSTSFYLNDEDSNVPESIHQVQEGGLTDGEPWYILLGNPTRRTGAFYDAVFGAKRHRWKSWVLDVRNVEGHNAQLIKEWAEDYGEDSDFFRVRVQGLPPNASDAQFIGYSLVKEAQARTVHVLPDEPLVAGCDLAWGGTDWNIIRFRRGADARTIPPIRIPGKLTADPGVLTNRLADVLTSKYDGRTVAMLFLDSAGIAGPIAQRLRDLGHRNVTEVNFGADSPDPKRRYYRDHMWAEMKAWLGTGAIDTLPRLEIDLQGPGLRPDNKQRIWLESKEDMKKRGEHSPDDGDALALTFAQRVSLRPKPLPPYAPSGKWG